MDRKYTYDLLPSGDSFSELVEFADTGYFDDQSVGDSWQQTQHEMTTYLREEPPEFGEFRQEEPNEIGDFLQKELRECGDAWQEEPPEVGDSPQIEPPERGDFPQKESGECDDLHQKPPETNDHPQEKVWVLPPSTPTSLPSLTPTTTYRIFTLTGVPLSQPTGMSPEETAMNILLVPQMTGFSPQMTYQSPHFIALSQQTVSISPQMNSILPQEPPSLVPLPHANTLVNSRNSFEIDQKNAYSCDFPTCNKVFTKKTNFNKHKKTHTKHTASKSYPCRYCNKCFSRKDHAKRHEAKQCPIRRKLRQKSK